MKASLVALYVGSLVLAASAGSPAENADAEARIKKTLKQTIIRKVEFHDTSLADALRFLHEATRRADPRGRGITFVSDIHTPIGPPAPLSEPSPPSLDYGSPASGPEDLKITVTLIGIPAWDLLQYLTGMANAKFLVRADSVHVVDRRDPELLITRTFPVPDDFFPAYEKQDRLDHTDVAKHMRRDIRGFLQENGAGFDEGATATLNADATRLTVRNTEDQLGFISNILQASRPPCIFPTYGVDVPKIISHGENAATVRKLQRIILPEVKFEDTRLVDAVQILRELSVRYDTEGPRTKRGVEIVLEESVDRLPASPASPASEKSDPRDDLSVDFFTLPISDRRLGYAAMQVTLLEVLDVIAHRGQWEVSIGPSAVTLRKPIPTPPARVSLSTWEYLIAPDEAAWLNYMSKSGPTPRGAIGSLMIANGVTLPKGTSAIFHPETSRLTLRNFERQQKAAQEAVNRMWRNYYGAEKTKQAIR